jgi:hypothetical protein
VHVHASIIATICCVDNPSDNDWNKIFMPGTKSEGLVTQHQFIGTNQKFLISPKQSYHYLYLNSDTAIGIEEKMNSEISIIIKQSSTELFNIKWSANILWEGKKQHFHIRFQTTTKSLGAFKKNKQKSFSLVCCSFL